MEGFIQKITKIVIAQMIALIQKNPWPYEITRKMKAMTTAQSLIFRYGGSYLDQKFFVSAVLFGIERYTVYAYWENIFKDGFGGQKVEFGIQNRKDKRQNKEVKSNKSKGKSRKKMAIRKEKKENIETLGIIGG